MPTPFRLRYTLFALIAIGFAPAWAWSSGEQGADNAVHEVSRSRSAPTIAELAEATYTGIDNQGPVTLSGGRWEGAPLIAGGSSVPALRLSAGFRLVGDLDQNGAEEAVAHLSYSSGGTGNFGYLAVMGRRDGNIVQKAIGLLGDRVQVLEAHIAGRSVVLDVLQAGPDDGMCCPSQLATRVFSIHSRELVETTSTVTGTASISILEGTAWRLRKLGTDEGATAAAPITLTFESGRVSGSTGCNRYQGLVSQGETATGLKIEQLTSTRMACPRPLMLREKTFLTLLDKVDVIQFLFGDLVLSGAEGVLIFSLHRD